jgi:Na+/H+-dicarboxylate symporter
MPKLALHWQILIAIALAFLIGGITSENTLILGVSTLGVFDFIGTLFLNGLKMIIVPLVVSSIICGVAGMGNQSIGRLGGKTLLFYMCSSLLAILIGLAVVNAVRPGVIDGQPAGDQLTLVPAEDVEKEIARAEGRGTGDIVQVFLRMVPPNVVMAAAEGQMLGIIFFALLFGYFMMRIPSANHRDTLYGFWQGVFQTMMAMTMFIMKFAPIGVFGLVAETIVVTGFEAVAIMWKFFVTVVLALAVHFFIALPIILKVMGRVSPILHYRAMAPALLTAFSTASSSGTLPLTMECVEKNAGVSNRTTSFCLPLGATINMDGTALYECVAVIFIAQAYGGDLSFATQFTVVLIALLTSIGVAGIPAASLVAIMVIMTVLELPLELIGLLMVTDRLLDMMRTAVNVFSDSCCAVVIGKSEGEEGILQVTSR